MTTIRSRKLMHLLMGGFLSFSVAYYFFPWRIHLALAFFVAMLLIEVIRQNSRFRAKIFLNWLTLGLARRCERKELTGAFWICLGLLIVSLLPNKTILCLAVISMGFADPMAEIAGRFLPIKRYPNGKSLGGSFGFFFTSLALNVLFLSYFIPTPHLILISFLTSIFAAIVESFSKRLNDNLTVLVLTTAFLYFIFWRLALI